jgi:hypothetical protein
MGHRETEKIEKHTSYGMVGINRCSSSGSYLFGSLALHHSFITLEIRRAERRRSLSSDWYQAESLPLIEIELTHEQFGTLITSPGVGNGVPCTIRHISGVNQGDCPKPEEITSKFADDLKETTKDMVKTLEELSFKLSEALLPGNKTLGKKELGTLLGGIQSAVQSIKSSIPFIEDSFVETMEKERDKAITELEGIRDHMLQDVALKAIAHAGKQMPEFRGLRVPLLNAGEIGGNWDDAKQGMKQYTCCGAYGLKTDNHVCDRPRIEEDNS